jgi:hypothetical protein
VQWNGTTLFNKTNLPYTTWTNLQFVVTGASSNAVLQFGFKDTPYFLGLDDISVTPISPPEFKAEQQTNSPNPAFNLTWSAIPGLTYQVQYSTNLSQTNWINLANPVTAKTNTLSISDTNGMMTSPMRFYRVVEEQ